MSEVSVRVAVRIRPLLRREVLHNHQVCVQVVPNTTQVMLGTLDSNRIFSFDHAFGPTASQDEVYVSCVQPLVEALLDGYNATVLCYGQTGSGKTYTLEGGNLGESATDDETGGIICRAAQDVFLLLKEKRITDDGLESSIRISYLELYKEELRDLLELHTTKKELFIREDDRGNTVVVGAQEMAVTSAEELLHIIESGNALRHTSATEMNEHSSRSHLILTIQLIQCCLDKSTSLITNCSAKLCLVDLAGSERAGKMAATGTQLKEAVCVNTGLLALNNVIRALSDSRRTCRIGAHVPYRDAKITRLLRDSLGGNAHTVMMVCVSPSQHSVAETLSVLQYAARACRIQNHPKVTCSQTEATSCPTTWHSGEAHLRELLLEIQTLQELLKEKERELEREKKWRGDGEKGDRLFHTDHNISQDESSQYRLLAQEAAFLLEDVCGPSPSQSFRERLQVWKERLIAVNHSLKTNLDVGSEEAGEHSHHDVIFQLRQELAKCQRILEQKDAELRQVQKELQEHLQESKALEEQKERTRIQNEHLVDQQIVIDRLRGNLMTFRGTTSGAREEACASGNTGGRPHSVPLISHTCGYGRTRKIHTSPPTFSLERVMAAFKIRHHLLLAELEEKDQMYCPFIKQQEESKDKGQEKEEVEDTFKVNMGFSRALNRTWTIRQMNSLQKQNNTGLDYTAIPQVTESKEHHVKPSHTLKAGVRASVTQKTIQALSVNMRMKKELISDLIETDKEMQPLFRCSGPSDGGRETDVLGRLSVQNHQLRSEVFCSLQDMRLQKAKLQTSIRNKREMTEVTQQLVKSEEQGLDVSTTCKSKHKDNPNEKASSWLEEMEERVLQRRTELHELEKELMRREEVLLHREDCLQQKTKLEAKRLRSSQALSKDLLQVSVLLESLEKQLQIGSSPPETGEVALEELEKERDILRKRRNKLDDQLKENRVLSVEEENSLLQLEEAVEALGAALEFKNQYIQKKQKNLSESSCQSPATADLSDIASKLRRLSPPEASELLVKYFNKVVCLREVQCSLQLRCEELELHVEEQEIALRDMETAVQHLSLAADRRLTQQQHDHQTNIQLLLQKLQDGGSKDTQQSVQEKLQHLEKELFFYRSSTRQLKKQLKLLSDWTCTVEQTSHTQTHRVQPHHNTDLPGSCTEQTKTHIAPTHSVILYENMQKNTHSGQAKMNQTDVQSMTHQNSCPSSCDLQTHTKAPSHFQMTTHPQSEGRTDSESVCTEEGCAVTLVRLCRRDLKEISSANLHFCDSASGRSQSVVATSTGSILDDSLEVPQTQRGDPCSHLSFQ
ncbi:kinesin-like protein KIF27 isoform X2 [Thalassophryne amazonica]|uniref:kinesin-like protein KIF27 isoform X2 n=1 Tax=Thalassophryne amazonica TaxID=390379 RepID=UPI0014723401|nr:kinesin-like protein KIF27 isoform X2 [Thalassophryne amazonica]